MNLKNILVLVAALAGTASAAVPDISGPWIILSPRTSLKTLDGAAPPLLKSGAATYATNKASIGSKHPLDPAGRCLPPGVPRVMMQNFPFNIVQGKTMYAMMFEWNHVNRIIHLVASHSDTIGPLYFGQSIGHWEGDTLVVDTNSYNDTTWLDDTGLPHSDNLHTIERLKLADDGKQLVDQVTIDDPTTYAATWKTRLVFKKDPSIIIKEDYCLDRLGLNKLASVTN